MIHDTVPPRPLLRRPARTAMLIVLAAVGVLGGARTAAADEFLPNPAVSVVSTCSSQAPYVTVTMTNVGGQDTAHFDIYPFGSSGSSGHFDVDPNATSTVSYQFAEGQAGVTVHSTETSGFVQDDDAGPFDCSDYQGAIVLTCQGAQPILTATFANEKVVDSEVTLSAGGSNVVAPETPTQTSLVLEVADRQPFTATLATELEGTFATLDGTPDCVPLETTNTTTSTTLVPTLMNSTGQGTGTVPSSALGSVSSFDTTTPPPSEDTLAFTGTTTLPMAGVGVTLIGLGTVIRRRATRLARR